jgi:hypothetical protein
LPAKVLLLTVSVPPLSIAPPSARRAELLAKVLLLTVSVPRLSIAPL